MVRKRRKSHEKTVWLAKRDNGREEEVLEHGRDIIYTHTQIYYLLVISIIACMSMCWPGISTHSYMYCICMHVVILHILCIVSASVCVCLCICVTTYLCHIS